MQRRSNGVEAAAGLGQCAQRNAWTQATTQSAARRRPAGVPSQRRELRPTFPPRSAECTEDVFAFVPACCRRCG